MITMVVTNTNRITNSKSRCQVAEEVRLVQVQVATAEIRFQS